MIELLSYDQNDMVLLATENGFPAFRGRQLYRWIHKNEVFDLEKMTDLPQGWRDFLKVHTVIHNGEQIAAVKSKQDETVKFLLRLEDVYIETVLMGYHGKNARDRNTLCVSTQAGCAMGCKFCATGKGGLERNLTVGEIIAQVNFANAFLRAQGETSVSNLVYMGMGEPLANLEATIKSIEIINDAKNIGMRRITVSTCGLVPAIDELAAMQLQLTLAVSLHAADNELRNQLMPINKRYPIEKLIEATDRYINITGRRITIEYALFNGINDSIAQAKQLVRLLEHKLYHVNLVPGNPVAGTELFASDSEKRDAFMGYLKEHHIEVSIRESKGKDIEGACGQLKARYNS